MATNALPYGPKILTRMQKDMSLITSRLATPRIELEKGHNIVVRFLPARLGPDKMCYARLGQHWLHEVTITCPRLTGDYFGGALDADCPVCTLALELNDDRDKDTRAFGIKVMAKPQFLTYCLLWEKDGVKYPMEEVVNPYELLLEERTWKQLARYYIAGISMSPDSILDYKKGIDFSLYQSNNGTRLDCLGQSTIFDVDDNFEKHIKKLEATLKNPKVQMPTQAQLEGFADKVHGEAIKFHRQRNGGNDRPRRGAECS